MQEKLTDKFRTLPNVISLLRLIFGAPVTIWLYASGYEFVWIVFLFFVATDWLDGFIARWFNAESSWGMMLDPLADQFFVLPIIWYFWWVAIPVVDEKSLVIQIPLFLTLREILMLALRLWTKKDTPAIWFGKIKVCVEYLGILLILFGGTWNQLGIIALFVAVLLAGFSFFIYFQNWVEG